MRTTLNIDDAALDLIKRYAGERNLSLGEAVAQLVQRGAENLPQWKTKNGWVQLDTAPGVPPLTPELVAALEEEAG